MAGEEFSVSVLLQAKDDASAALKRVEQEIKKLSNTAEQGGRQASAAAAGTEKLAQSWLSLNNVMQVAGVAAGFQIIGGGAAVLGQVAQGMVDVVKGGIAMNASLETATLQFTTFMGSASQAEAHVKQLFDFAAKTPFGSEEVIAASRQLQTLGGAALNTNSTLKLVGDAAAATSSSFQEVSFWVARAYSAIQAGRPFGESAARLQELGIMSGDVRNRMEDLQKVGGKSGEIWGLLTGDLGRLKGAMDLQANTLDGLSSTFQDNFSIIAGIVTKPIFEELKKALTDINATLASDETKQAAADYAKVLGDIALGAHTVAKETDDAIVSIRGLARAQQEALREKGIPSGIPIETGVRQRRQDTAGDFGADRDTEADKRRSSGMTDEERRATDKPDKNPPNRDALGRTDEEIRQSEKIAEETAKRIAKTNAPPSVESQQVGNIRQTLAGMVPSDRQAFIDKLTGEAKERAELALIQLQGDPVQRDKDNARQTQENIADEKRDDEKAKREAAAAAEKASKDKERLDLQMAKDAVSDKLDSELKGIERNADAAKSARDQAIRGAEEERDRIEESLNLDLKRVEAEETRAKRGDQDADAAKSLASAQEKLASLSRDKAQAEASHSGKVGSIAEQIREQEQRVEDLKNDQSRRVRDRAFDDKKGEIRGSIDVTRDAFAEWRQEAEDALASKQPGFDQARDDARQREKDALRFLEGRGPAPAGMVISPAAAATTAAVTQQSAGGRPINLTISGPISVGNAEDVDKLRGVLKDALKEALTRARQENAA